MVYELRKFKVYKYGYMHGYVGLLQQYHIINFDIIWMSPKNKIHVAFNGCKVV
jgi:hypothetical protein